MPHALFFAVRESGSCLRFTFAADAATRPTCRNRADRRYSLLVILPVFLYTAPGFGQSVLLKPRFQPGQEYYVEITKEIEQHTSGKKLFQELTAHRIEIECVRHKVDQVDPSGGASLTLTIDRLALDNESQGKASSCDTDGPSAGEDLMSSCFMRPAIGQPMRMVLDGECQVTSFEGMDAIYDRIRRTVEAHPQRADLEQRLNQIKSYRNDPVARAIWGESPMSLYACKEVGVGDKWDRIIQRKDPAVGVIEITVRCKLKNLYSNPSGGQIAEIAYEAEIHGGFSPAQEAAEPELGMTVKDLKGNMVGLATFDASRGLVVEDTESGSLRFTVFVPRRPGEDEAQTLKIEQKVTATTRVLTPEERQAQRSHRVRNPKPRENP